MPIDASQVKWDSPTPSASLDPSTVKWDGAPSADAGSLAQEAFKEAASHATPEQLKDVTFGSGLAHAIGAKFGVDPASVLPENPEPAPYKEGGPAAAAGAFMQGFAKPLAQAASVPVGLAAGLAGRDTQDSLFKTYDRMNSGGTGEADIARSPTAGGLGTLGGSLAGFALAPQAAGADALPLVAKLSQGGKASQTIAAALEHALTSAPGAIAAGGLPQGSVAAAKTLQDGGTLPQAFGEAAASGAMGAAQFLAPASLEGNIAVRAGSGMAIQQAMSQAQQQAQHAIAPDSFAPAKAPDLTDPMTYLGAVLGAAGGHGPVEGYASPDAARLAEAAKAAASDRMSPANQSGPLALPAPEAAAEPSVAPPAAPPVTDLPTASAAFIADPKAALSSLDPVVLHQVASDAGFTIRPGTAPSTIIDTVMGKGTPFLHSDVLPEYMAALQEHGLPSAASNAAAVEPPSATATPAGPQDFAQALQAVATVPVDASGTAYTPQQGMASLSDALAKRATGGEQLPAPVTTVDSQGNAMDSARFLAKTRAAQQEAESQQNAVLNRQHLGITPDIERTQAPRWKQQEALSQDNANRLSTKPDGDLATQRDDDSPPWWLAGQHAADEAGAPNTQALQDAIKAPTPANAPMHPWSPVVTADVPYAGGKSNDLKTSYIDPRIPQTLTIQGKPIDVHEAIGLHEDIEGSLIHNAKVWSPAEMDALAKRVGLQSVADFPKQVREKLGAGQALSYTQGHNIATKGENHLVATKYDVPAAKYQMGLQSAIKAARAKATGAAGIPHDLDSKPYDNMGESHLVPGSQDLESLRKEIGWDQVGGRLLRAPEEDGQGGHAPVAGRTTWVGKAGPDGESTYWRMRPAEGGKLTEKQAHAALDKHASGESLTTREQRFIDYSKQVQAGYDADYQADLERYQQDQRDMPEASRHEALQLHKEAHVPPADEQEALTLSQLVDRAYDAGADQRQILDATFDGTVHDQARALWDLTRQLEERHAQPESSASRDQADNGSTSEGLARTRAAEPQAERETATAEQDRTVPEQADQVKGDLFAPATVKDRLRAANEAKDDARNGRTGGRDDTRDGGLFDGQRPEQASLDQADRTEVTEHSLDDNSPESAQGRRALDRQRGEEESDRVLMDQMRKESRDQGERDATEMGIRDAVSKALGGLGGNLKVEFVRNEMGLPEGSGLRQLPKGSRRVGTFFPRTGKVYIFTGSKPSPADAAFTAAHEVYGHRAMAKLAEAHPDVKVGSLTAHEALTKALDMAMQNPTVAAVAASMRKQRGSTDRRLLAEEALADLSAAAQTGNWDKIKTKHGVDVPEVVRNGVKGAIANFIERMKRLLNAIMSKITGKKADFTDAQVREFMQDSADALRMDDVAHSKKDVNPMDATDHQEIADLEKSLISTHPGLKLDLSENAREITLSRIEFPSDQRNLGEGTSVMREITDYADASGKRIVLTPSGDFGGNKARLHDFYTRHGFTDNRGSSRDFTTRETMIRDPHKAMDSVEASESTPLSLSMVKQALRDRGVSDEAIAGMSRDQLRAEQASLRARSEPTPEQAATGVKNATKEEERAMKGKAAVEHDLSTTNPAQYARAKAQFDADPHAGQILASKVITDKKSITPEDSILLSLDAMRIINARQTAYEQAESAMSRGDDATRAAALSLVRQLDGQMEANDIASRYSGVRAGQALQARKVMIQQDYSMARMVLRGKVAKGSELTDAERNKIEQAASAIAQRTKELDAREAKLRAMEAEARPVAQKRAAKMKFDDLASQLKAIAQKDQMKSGCVV